MTTKTVGHTRAPWLSEENASERSILIFDDTGLNRHIAYMPVHSMPDGEQEANARLIKAAPKLLAAAKALVNRLENITTDQWVHGCHHVEQQDLEAAIAEATGETP